MKNCVSMHSIFICNKIKWKGVFDLGYFFSNLWFSNAEEEHKTDIVENRFEVRVAKMENRTIKYMDD